jgi:predicted transcriptional regulator
VLVHATESGLDGLRELEVARRLEITPSVCAARLKRLVKNAWVDRLANGHYRPTAKGIAVITST